jgi:hypothetical protein
MKKIGIIVLGLFVTFASFSQEKKSTWKYAEITFIKTTPGGEYAKFLEEKSAVIFQERANNGYIFGWDVWQFPYTTPESPYDMVIVTLHTSLDSIIIDKGVNWKSIANYSDQDIKNLRENLSQSRKIVNRAIITPKHSWSKNEDASDYATFSYVKVKNGKCHSQNFVNVKVCKLNNFSCLININHHSNKSSNINLTVFYNSVNKIMNGNSWRFS